MAYDPEVCAIHETGHAVFIFGAGWGSRLDYVEITPASHQEGGRTVLFPSHCGKAPIHEQFREIGKNLAGPLAEIVFNNSSITESWRARLSESLVGNVSSIQDLVKINGRNWEGDLEDLLSLKNDPDDAGKPKYRAYLRAEKFIRTWFLRESVRASITKMSGYLLDKEKLRGNEIANLVDPLLTAHCRFIDFQIKSTAV